MNGLSVAWHLAERGADVVVLDKGRVGGGASGIAGGIVRNYYRSEAITELVRLSVEMFEEDPEAYGFRQVGYMAAVPERQVDDLVAIRDQHERAGYDSELVTGAAACHEYLTWSWPDWEAPVEAVLHERRGGWADAMQTVRHLAGRARAAGAEIREEVEVTGFEPGRVHTSRGRCGVRDGRGLPGPVGRAALGAARPRSGRGDGRRAAPTRDLHQGAGGRVRARGRGAQRGGGRGGAGGAPRPGRPAALGPRRERARGRPLGHLLPDGPHGHRHHGRRPPGVPGRTAAGPLRPGQSRARGRAGVHGLLRVGPGHRAARASADARTTGA